MLNLLCSATLNLQDTLHQRQQLTRAHLLLRRQRNVAKFECSLSSAGSSLSRTENITRTQDDGHYALFKVIQGHLFRCRWKAVCDFLLVNNSTYILSRTLSMLSLSISQIFAFEWGCLSISYSLSVFSENIRSHIAENYTLWPTYCRQYWTIFNYFDVIGPKIWNSVK